MHKHWCDVVGHEYECDGESCECVCGLRMEGNDHSDCPVELRACPEHPEGIGDTIAEPAADAVEIDFTSIPEEAVKCQSVCECGCADLDAMQIVGWCLWCSHVYSDWAPALEDEHFAKHCPGIPEKGKRDALASLERRKAKAEVKQ